MANLVKNCVEHTPTGGTIRIRYESSALYTQVVLSDTGEGVDAERIFPISLSVFTRARTPPRTASGLALLWRKIL